MIIVVMEMHFLKIKPQVSYRKYKDFITTLHQIDTVPEKTNTQKPSLIRLNVQGQFLNERGLEIFSTICTKIFDKHTPKKSHISNLT